MHNVMKNGLFLSCLVLSVIRTTCRIFIFCFFRSVSLTVFLLFQKSNCALLQCCSANLWHNSMQFDILFILTFLGSCVYCVWVSRHKWRKFIHWFTYFVDGEISLLKRKRHKIYNRNALKIRCQQSLCNLSVQ